MNGRDYVTPDDVQRLAVPVLAHRVIPRGYAGRSDAAKKIVEDALACVPVPTEKR